MEIDDVMEDEKMVEEQVHFIEKFKKEKFETDFLLLMLRKLIRVHLKKLKNEN